MKTVVIIVGAARSGSTLLAKALGGHSNCFALGEINRFNAEINNPETHCGCASKLKDCSFWNEIIKSLQDKNNISIKAANDSFKVGIFKQLTKKKRLYKLFPLVLFKSSYKDKSVDVEVENTFKLYNEVFSKTKANVLIDSTKGFFRALVLASRKPKEIDIKFIQLTRDGRGVLNSGLKSSYKINHKDGITREYGGDKKNSPSKIVNSWLYINIRNFILLKLFYRKKSIFIKYEYFTSEPSTILKKALKFVGLEYEESALDLGENENHILGGNSSRINAKKIVRQDDKWKTNLSDEILTKFNRKAGWLNKLLGYN